MVYSADLKKKVVESYLNNEGSIRVLAKRFKVAPSTVQKWLNRYREKGDFGHNKKNCGRKSILTQDQLQQILAFLRKEPNQTLADIVDYVQDSFGKSISTPTMSRLLKEQKWTYKKKRWQQKRRRVKESKD